MYYLFTQTFGITFISSLLFFIAGLIIYRYFFARKGVDEESSPTDLADKFDYLNRSITENVVGALKLKDDKQGQHIQNGIDQVNGRLDELNQMNDKNREENKAYFQDCKKDVHLDVKQFRDEVVGLLGEQNSNNNSNNNNDNVPTIDPGLLDKINYTATKDEVAKLADSVEEINSKLSGLGSEYHEGMKKSGEIDPELLEQIRKNSTKDDILKLAEAMKTDFQKLGEENNVQAQKDMHEGIHKDMHKDMQKDIQQVADSVEKMSSKLSDLESRYNQEQEMKKSEQPSEVPPKFEAPTNVSNLTRPEQKYGSDQHRFDSQDLTLIDGIGRRIQKALKNKDNVHTLLDLSKLADSEAIQLKQKYYPQSYDASWKEEATDIINNPESIHSRPKLKPKPKPKPKTRYRADVVRLKPRAEEKVERERSQKQHYDLTQVFGIGPIHEAILKKEFEVHSLEDFSKISQNINREINKRLFNKSKNQVDWRKRVQETLKLISKKEREEKSYKKAA